jgi:hypothetical protein
MFKARLAKYTWLFSFVFLFSAFSPEKGSVVVDYNLSVALGSEDFRTFSDKIYQRFELKQEALSADVFELALRGYLLLKYNGELENDRFLTIIDFSKSSKERRLWVIDFITKKVLIHDLVAHGKNSGQEYANSFSNRFESRQTSLGFYSTGSIYNGKHRLSLKLKGMEYGFNHNAFARGIVFHGANYVDDRIVAENQQIGRSFGCPAVAQDVNQTLVSMIKDGSCVFHYAPVEYYLKHSKILNSDSYIPLRELKDMAE